MSHEEGRWGDGAGGGESLQPLPGRWSCPRPPPPPVSAPAGAGSGPFRAPEVMPCCSGESPARGAGGRENGAGSLLAKGAAQQTAGGWVGVPGGLLEHPCRASLLLSQPPLGVSPLPHRMRWAGKEAALSNSHCETA